MTEEIYLTETKYIFKNVLCRIGVRSKEELEKPYLLRYLKAKLKIFLGNFHKTKFPNNQYNSLFYPVVIHQDLE